MSELASGPSDNRPVLRIVRGEPTDEEIAALVVALNALRQPSSGPQPRRSTWSDRSALLRRPLHAGPIAWRTSCLPS